MLNYVMHCMDNVFQCCSRFKMVRKEYGRKEVGIKE
jgi:hypothetical protein